MSKVEELDLNPKAFNNMQNLRFLEFYGSKHGMKVTESDSFPLCLNVRFLKRNSSKNGKKVHGFEKLESNFSKLRYFCFHGYPAKSLPPNFNPKNLVALYMRNSKVKKLWTNNQVLVNLKHIDLSHSKHLCRIPDFSLMPNLESLNLEDCTNSLKSFLSIRNLHKLVILHLQGCKSLKNLSISDNCQSLREVNLSNCSNLETVQHLFDTVEELYLDGTAIKELPSIGHLFRLVKLSLRKCARLERLPDSISEMKSLKCLYLSGGSKLDRLPNDMGNLQTLEVLELEEISFAEILTFMTSLFNLKTLSLTRCKVQKRLDFPLVDLSIFKRMRELSLVDCCIEVLPSSIGQLFSLEYLNLGQNNLETLPESIKDLSKLERLSLSNCQRLKYLPELPRSLSALKVKNCKSLESISSLPAANGTFGGVIKFINCFKLKLDMTDALLNFEGRSDYLYHHLYRRKVSLSPTLFGRCVDALDCYSDIIWFQQLRKIVYPGGEIPKWFDLKSNESFIKFPEGWVNDNLIGFAFCVVVSLQDYRQNVGFHLIVNGEMIQFIYLMDLFRFREGEDVIKSDHVAIGYVYIDMLVKFPTLNLNSQGGVEFFVEHATKNGVVRSQVKKSGVTLLYAKNNDLRRDAKVDKNDERSLKPIET